jgi:hypothetical protein
MVAPTDALSKTKTPKQLTAHRRLASLGGRCYRDLAPRAEGPCLHPVERALCYTLQAARQASLLADDEAREPKNACVRGCLSSIMVLVAKNSPQDNRAPEPKLVEAGNRDDTVTDASLSELGYCRHNARFCLVLRTNRAAWRSALTDL